MLPLVPGMNTGLPDLFLCFCAHSGNVNKSVKEHFLRMEMEEKKPGVCPGLCGQVLLLK